MQRLCRINQDMVDRKGLLGFPRIFNIGPLVKETPNQSQSRNWKEMSIETLDGEPGWNWQINDELAHKVWQLTINSRYVGFGPKPPVLLEAAMGFFDSMSLSDSSNNWYFTRKVGESFNDHTTWWQIGTKFKTPDGEPGTTDVLYSADTQPHPLKSKLHGQQYTSNGGMFTYDFNQWQGEDPTGMMRIPVTSDLLDDLRDDISSTPFEQTQMQSRTYRDNFSDGPTPVGTFAHPHFAPRGETSQDDYFELFEIAIEYMERSVRMENS